MISFPKRKMAKAVGVLFNTNDHLSNIKSYFCQLKLLDKLGEFCYSQALEKGEGTDMSNVLKFPKTKRSLPAFDINSPKIKAMFPKGSTAKSILVWVWLIVRLPVFLLMYWLRLPVIFLCNLISFPMLLLWLFALYAFPDKHSMVWGFGTISFLAFVIGWTYDFILMAISPQDMIKSL